MKAILTTLTFLILFTGAAMASTPDGETPAEETICHEYNGASFGLCNAWCEAMDCHCYDEGDDCTASASENACDKVAARFLKFSGEALTTCEPTTATAPPACPCLDTAKWSGDGTWAAIVNGNSTFGYSGTLDTCDANQTLGSTDDVELTGEWVAVNFNGDQSTCSWGSGTDGINTLNTSLTISAEEADACLAELAAACS